MHGQRNNQKKSLRMCVCVCVCIRTFYYSCIIIHL